MVFIPSYFIQTLFMMFHVGCVKCVLVSCAISISFPTGIWKNKMQYNTDREKEVDRLTREKISKEMKVPAFMISVDSDIYKNTYNYMNNQVPIDYTKDKSVSSDVQKPAVQTPVNEHEHEPVKKPALDTKKPKASLQKMPDAYSVKGDKIAKKIHWLDLPTQDELERYSEVNDICKSLVAIYKARFKEVEEQVLELQMIAQDIDRYSNYK